MKRLICCIFLCSLSTILLSQTYSRGDSLRGNLSSLRSAYDVFFYDLDVVVDCRENILDESSNEIYLLAKTNFQSLQIDLSSSLQIISIEFEDEQLQFYREFNAVFISLSREIIKGEKIIVKFNYYGKPQVAKNPPWDGGFSWQIDDNSNPLIGVSCQGLGASSWWPCKDHQSDEPDSMRITITSNLKWPIISNGNLISDSIFTINNVLSRKSSWFVSYPINSYNVTLYIGDYIHFSDVLLRENDTLSLDYYVLSYNKEKAQNHFKQVKPMLECFEKYFGPYPFLNDGYALIESSYLGMEHQSAIAYGNNYLPGYNGNTNYTADLDFDFIIVHETGHEWWGNSITSNDIADMWVHEGFCTYSEVLYVECMYGYQKMLEYVNNQKNRVINDKAVICDFHVNCKGSSDMYSKGSLMLNTLRNVINNDSLWFAGIKGLAIQKKHSTLDGVEVINYFNRFFNLDLSKIFEQYLSHKDIPEFEYKFQKKGRSYSLIYRWNAINDFDMPLIFNVGINEKRIFPSSDWQELSLGSIDKKDFVIRDDLLFINIKKT